jgi:formate dehydrogenase major subunit
VVFIPFHFAEAAANLLTIDALDPQAKIPEFKACAVKIEAVSEAELAHPEVVLARGRY